MSVNEILNRERRFARSFTTRVEGRSLLHTSSILYQDGPRVVNFIGLQGPLHRLLDLLQRDSMNTYDLHLESAVFERGRVPLKESQDALTIHDNATTSAVRLGIATEADDPAGYIFRTPSNQQNGCLYIYLTPRTKPNALVLANGDNSPDIPR